MLIIKDTEKAKWKYVTTLKDITDIHCLLNATTESLSSYS